MGIMPTKTELALEQTQQGVSDKVLNNKVILYSIHSDDENPTSANIKQALRQVMSPATSSFFINEGRYALDKSLHGHSQQGSSTGPLLSDDMETKRVGSSGVTSSAVTISDVTDEKGEQGQSGVIDPR
ncbi:hypothetical protein Tco_0252788 [Tanacetum coccineum]